MRTTTDRDRAMQMRRREKAELPGLMAGSYREGSESTRRCKCPWPLPFPPMVGEDRPPLGGFRDEAMSIGCIVTDELLLASVEKDEPQKPCVVNAQTQEKRHKMCFMRRFGQSNILEDDALVLSGLALERGDGAVPTNTQSAMPVMPGSCDCGSWLLFGGTAHLRAGQSHVLKFPLYISLYL